MRGSRPARALALGAVALALLGTALYAGVLLGRGPLAEPAASGEARGEGPARETAEGRPATVEFSGRQNRATDPFELSAGLARLEVEYEGEGRIAVYAYDEAGEQYFLFGEDGPLSVSEAEPVEIPGTYVLEIEVENEAPWTVRIKQ